MKQKTLVLVVLAVVLIAGAGLYIFTKPKNLAPNISSKPSETKKEAKPSETFIEYTDPAGFSFNYPDNLSIEKNEEMNKETYADLQLFSKDVNGSLSLRITDTKLKTLKDWAKEASASSTTEKKLGNMQALEAKYADRITLAAIDQGVLFTVEVPLLEQGFWMPVYNKVISDFNFSNPETAAVATTGSSGSSDEVVFESEEVVE